jgi:hypothetical protein
MPAKLFQRKGLSREVLIRLLVVLLALEIALVAGWYVSGKNASDSGQKAGATATATPSAVSTANPARKPCIRHGLQNSPRTVITDQIETFSVCLPNLPNVVVPHYKSH